MSYEKLKEFILHLHNQGFSINEIQKAIITNHNMVLCLDDVQGLLDEALSAQSVQKHARTCTHARTRAPYLKLYKDLLMLENYAFITPAPTHRHHASNYTRTF